MSEKKIYVFGTTWGYNNGKSVRDKYISDKVVFLDNSDEYYSDLMKNVTIGDIILLRIGSNMQGNVRFGYIGIANRNAEIKKLYSSFPLYETDSDDLLPETNKNSDIVYITVDKWYEVPDTFQNKASGMADRIICIRNNGKYDDAYNRIMHIYNELFIKDKMENEIFELLTSNHNLILTGAPGTGKTYLAKQIAAKMIFGEDITLKEIEDNEDNEDKKAKFEYQYKFVQFHPSYDYTDFVEGIRPVTKEDNSYGFIRKDGTFKEFCKRAAKNIVDSQKTIDELSNEEVILKYLDKYTDFIIEQIDENDVYYIGEKIEN